MKGKVYKSPNARKDLAGIFRYYTREAGLTVARRFFEKVDTTTEHLAEMPGMGALYHSDLKHLSGMRSFPISGFEKHLVFYRPVKDGIEIIRVIHSARDVWNILGKPTN